MTRPLILSLLVASLLAVGARAAETDADERTLREAGIATDGRGLLQFFRARTVGEADRAKVEKLITQLGAEEFTTREQATRDIVTLGPVAEPLLRQAAARAADPEVKQRAELCLRQIAAGSRSALLGAAARLLAVRKPDGAADVLLAYVPFAADESVADEVRLALAAVAAPGGKPLPAVVAALADKQAARRTAAGVALAPVAAVRADVRKLLHDGDVSVRLRVAQALARTGDREAVPVLIAGLAEAPVALAVSAEEMLLALAGDKAPQGSVERDRAKYRDAWAAWWQAHAATVDMARLDGRPTELGYTLIVERTTNLSKGRVAELDREGKLRWEITGLAGPVDAQVLPGGRVLVAEYASTVVTERNLRGDILWQYNLGDMPVAVQRLPNGHTFIVGRTSGVVEVDRDGKELSRRRLPVPLIYAARRLRTGEVVVLTSTGQCVRLDATGKQVSSFMAGRMALHGGFDVLADGSVLLPIYTENRVVLYDAQGKPTWEAKTNRPASAVRLPNGNTLVASSLGRSVVEIDRDGKEVRRFSLTDRPFKAYRR